MNNKIVDVFAENGIHVRNIENGIGSATCPKCRVPEMVTVDTLLGIAICQSKQCQYEFMPDIQPSSKVNHSDPKIRERESGWETVKNKIREPNKELAAKAAHSGGAGGAPDEPEGGYKTTVMCLADIEPDEVSWLWWPYIPIGKLTLLEGDPGVGKSWITLGIATSLSLGAALSGAEPYGPAKTLLYTAEDGLADTIRPRLDAMGADVTKIHAEPEPLTFDKEGLERIEADIERLRPALVIIDPIVAFMGAKVDINKANETRAILAHLAGIAERYGTSILAVRHLRKSESTKAMYRGAGSIDFTAAARSVLLVGRDPDDHDSRAVAHIKSNLAEMGPSLGYEIHEGCFAWTGVSDLTAEQLLAGDMGKNGKSAQDEAETFLLDLLAEGPVEANEVTEQAQARSISNRTLNRAKKALKVDSDRKGGPKSKWFWQLPAPHGSSSDSLDCQTSYSENLATYGKTGNLYNDSSVPEVSTQLTENSAPILDGNSLKDKKVLDTEDMYLEENF